MPTVVERQITAIGESDREIALTVGKPEGYGCGRSNAMYTSYFGFQHKPFNLSPDPRFFFSGTVQRHVLTEVLAAARERRGAVVLVGAAGTGKTAVMRKILGRLDADMDAVVLQYPNVDVDGLMSLLADELGIDLLDGPRLERVEQIKATLEARLDEGLPVVAFIDEAQNLSHDVLRLLFQFASIETDAGVLLQLVLIGQPEICAHIESLGLQASVEVWLQLDQLGADEVPDFIRHQLHAAGCPRDDLFDADAITLLDQLTEGNPRLLNLFCDNALAHVYFNGGQRVTVDAVEQARRPALYEPPVSAAAPSAVPSSKPEEPEPDRSLAIVVREHFADLFDTLGSDIKTLKTKVKTLMKGQQRLDHGWLAKFTRGGRQQPSTPRFDTITGVAVACGVLVVSLLFMAPQSEPDWGDSSAADAEPVPALDVAQSTAADQQVMVISMPGPKTEQPEQFETRTVVEVDQSDPSAAPARPSGSSPGAADPTAGFDVVAAAPATTQAMTRVPDEPPEIELLQSDLERVLAANQELATQLETLRAERDQLARAPVLPADTPAVSSQSVTEIAAVHVAPATSGDHYRVQAGDTLWSIAQRHQISVDQVRAWNGLSTQSILRTGQKLRITEPARPIAIAAAPRQSQTAAVNEDGVAIRYTVQRGDTLYGIARRFKVSVTELNQWNSLGNDSELRAGQTIKVVRTL
jgi:general secretion pathway protein A